MNILEIITFGGIVLVAAVLTGVLEINLAELNSFILYLLPIFYNEYRMRTNYINQDGTRKT